MIFKHNMRDIKRASTIINVLFKHGLGYFIEEFGMKYHLSIINRFKKQKKPEKIEQRLREAMETLGGTYIKLGQLLSIRPDLVPESFCNEFAKLQDQVPPEPYSVIKQTVEQELNQPLNKVFKEFDKTPLGSASIGQVHKAKLKNGKSVTVKVKRPNIEETIKADIDLMYFIAKQIEKHLNHNNFKPVEIVKEFERYSLRELDYITEARNAESIITTKNVITPSVYWDYTTQNLLVMDYIEGEKLSDLLNNKKKFNHKQTAITLIDSLTKQIFESGHFHADMHPGNILIKNNKIALLDYGIVGRLQPELMRKGMTLYIHLIDKDIDRITNTLLSIGKPSADTNQDEFRAEVEDVVQMWYGKRLKDIRITTMMHKLLNASIEQNISMPNDLILLSKALVTVEGTCKQLDPNFNFVKHSEPYIRSSLKKRFGTTEMIHSALAKSGRVREILYNLPDHASDILKTIKQGTIKIDLDDTDLRKLSLELDRSSNRLSYGIVIASLVIGGSILTQTSIGPSLLGYPALATICFAIAIMLSLVLVVSIMREGKNL